MTDKVYNIGKLKYRQQTLTYGQDKKLIALYDKMNIRNEDAEITFEEIQKLLRENDLMMDFLEIILTPQRGWRYYLRRAKCFILRRRFLDIDNLGNDIIEQIFDDFFLLNKQLIMRLASYANVLGLIARTVMHTAALKSNDSTMNTTSNAKTSAG